MEATIPTAFSRKNPFPGRVRVNKLLSLPGSAKEIRHFEVDIAGSGLIYEVGDSLGVVPQNDIPLVDELIETLKLDPSVPVPSLSGETVPLRQALTRDYHITAPTKEFLLSVASKLPAQNELKQWIEDPTQKEALQKYLHGREIIDVLKEQPTVQFEAVEFAKSLRKIQPRLYSIASSQKTFPESVHLTIATLSYETYGRIRKGVASNFLAACESEKVLVFVHTAKHFRLPEDPSVPVIMVGPGTGVAPFRAFLQERGMTSGSGKNWLFFGDQKAEFDFLYKDELQEFQRSGVLNRLDTAFSRDQEHKIYVQNRMLENASEIYAWLEQGGYFYVCGDATRMAGDVDLALHQIIERAGGKSAEEAKEYVEAMKQAKRYRRDVY